MYEFGTDKIARLDELRDVGINPYPHELRITHTVAETLELMGDRSKEELTSDETEVVVAGRIKLKRGKGKAGFAHIQDRSGTVQIYVRKDEWYKLFQCH